MLCCLQKPNRIFSWVKAKAHRGCKPTVKGTVKSKLAQFALRMKHGIDTVVFFDPRDCTAQGGGILGAVGQFSLAAGLHISINPQRIEPMRNQVNRCLFTLPILKPAGLSNQPVKLGIAGLSPAKASKLAIATSGAKQRMLCF